MNRHGNIPRKQSFRLAIAAGVLIVMLCSWLEIRQPLWLFHRQDFRDANLVIRRVETFRNEKGRLPDSLEDLGAKNLPDQIYYQRVDAKDYQVWFSTALGESEIYESATKQWR